MSRREKKRQAVVNAINLFETPHSTLRRWIYLFLAIEFILVATHILVATQFASYATLTDDGHIGGFDLDDEANVAVWFSSFQLLLLAIFSLLNSWLDCKQTAGLSNRCLWIFSGFLFLFMSIDETGGLHELFGHAMTVIFPGIPMTAKEWFTMPYIVFVGMVFCFLLLRVIYSPVLGIAVVCSAVFWCAAIALEHGIYIQRIMSVALEEWAEMLGATLLLFVVVSSLLNLRDECIQKISEAS